MTIASAIDYINDKLAGSDQQSAQTIEQALMLLADNISGGGSIPIASADTLGGIKVGENLSITEGGVLSASGGGGGGGALIIQTEFDDNTSSYIPVGVTYEEVVASLSENAVIMNIGGLYLNFGGFQLDADYAPTNCLVFHGFQDQWDSSTDTETCAMAYTIWDPSYPDLMLSTISLSS